MIKSEEYLRKFKLALNCKFSSEKTISSYYSCVKSFFEYSKCMKCDTEELVKSYLVFGIKSKSPKTINLYRSAIIKFFELVLKKKFSTIDIPRKLESKTYPKIVDRDTVLSVIKSVKNIKHKLIIMMLYDCGMRLSEVINLKRKNIFDKKDMLWLQCTKGNKERFIPISESLKFTLYPFISDIENDDYVFGGICGRTVQKIINNSFAKFGIKVTPHMLRHSFATELISIGENVYKVQGFMGHSSIKTTATYVHLSESIMSKKPDLLSGNYAN